MPHSLRVRIKMWKGGLGDLFHWSVPPHFMVLNQSFTSPRPAEVVQGQASAHCILISLEPEGAFVFTRFYRQSSWSPERLSGYAGSHSWLEITGSGSAVAFAHSLEVGSALSIANTDWGLGRGSLRLRSVCCSLVQGDFRPWFGKCWFLTPTEEWNLRRFVGEHGSIKTLPGARCASAQASVDLPGEGLALLPLGGSRLST